MASLADLQAITAGTWQAAPSGPGGGVAPSASNPSGWAPPAGSQVNYVPVIDVGGAAGAAAGQPGSELQAVPASNPSAPLGTPRGAVSGPASGSGVSPLTGAVLNQLRARQGQPVTVGGQTFTGPTAQHVANIQRAIVDPGWGTPQREAQNQATAAGKTTGYLPNILAGIASGVGSLASMTDYANPMTAAAHLAGLPTPGSAIGNAVQASPMVAGVVPANTGQELARAAASGAVQTVAMGPAGAEGGLAAELPKLALIGAGGGAGGQEMADLVPTPFKPAAQLAGNLMVGGGVAAGMGLATAAARGTIGALRGGAEMVGSGATVPLVHPDTGEPLLHPETGQPIMAPASVAARAQANVARAAGMGPAELAALLRKANPNGPSVPPTTAMPGQAGFEASMGQTTGNLGLLAEERRLRNLHREAFIAADAANTAAVHATAGRLAPGGAAEAVAQFVQTHLDMQHAAEEAEAASLRATAEAKTAAQNGDPNATDLAEQAEAGRQRLDAMRVPIKAAASRAMELVDPNGNLGVPTGGVPTVARALLGDARAIKAAGPEVADFAVGRGTGEELTGPERRVLAAASNLRGEIVPFKTLNGLAGQIAQAMRETRATPGIGAESRAFRRLVILRGAVEEAMTAGLADHAEAELGAHAAQAPEAAGETPPPVQATGTLANVARAATEAHAPDAGTTVFTPSGRRIAVRYELRPASSLIASHDDDLRPNPAYPAELQPRNRASAASRQQIDRLAANLEPARLGASASAAEGAPIIGPDGVVESGNGRLIALRRVLVENGPQAAAYRAWLRTQGYEPAGPDDVLVRVRETPLSDPDRVQWAREGNASPVMALSASERGISDARRLPDGVLSLWRGGDIGAAANRDFVRSFMRAVPEGGEEADLLTPDGALSIGGESRIRNALLARAYGDQRLLLALSERGDESLGAFGNAMMDAAGTMAKVRVGIENGTVSPDVGITGPLLEAVRAVVAAKGARMSLRDYVNQDSMFGGAVSDDAQELLKVMFGDDMRGRAGRARFAGFLEEYGRMAQSVHAGPDLLGASLTARNLIEEAARATETGARTRAVSRRETAAGPHGPGGGEGGNAAGGLGLAAPGPENAAGGANGPEGTASQPVAGNENQPGAAAPAAEPETPLVPMTAADAARRDAANRAYAIYKTNWRRGPVGEALAPGPTSGTYRLSASAALAKLFRPGAAGGHGMDALAAATGSPETAARVLGDLPAYQLRAYAERDGVLDPKRAERWIDLHREALNRLPALREQFQDAASASRAIGEAAKRAEAVRADIESSALGHFIGRDPGAAIQKLLNGQTPVADARDLMKRLGDNADAVQGARRATAEWLIGRMRTTSEAGTTGIREISRPALIRILETPEKAQAVRVLLGTSGFDTLKGIANALDLMARAHTAVAIKGSPGTAADLAAMGRNAHPSLLAQVAIGDLLGEAAGHVVGAAGGPLGLMLRAAGVVAGAVHRTMQINGAANVEDLETLALLHPNTIGRALLERPAATARAPIIGTLARRLAAVSTSAIVTANRERTMEKH